MIYIFPFQRHTHSISTRLSNNNKEKFPYAPCEASYWSAGSSGSYFGLSGKLFKGQQQSASVAILLLLGMIKPNIHNCFSDITCHALQLFSWVYFPLGPFGKIHNEFPFPHSNKGKMFLLY